MTATEHLELRIAAAQAHAGYIAEQLQGLLALKEITKEDVTRIMQLAAAPSSAALQRHAADVLTAEAGRWPRWKSDKVSRSSVRERLEAAAVAAHHRADHLMEQAFPR